MRRAVAVGAIVLAVVIAAVTITLGIRNGSFGQDPFVFLMVAMIVGYVLVGGLVAVRLPRNMIGWLMMGAGLSLLLGGFWSEYAVYALATARGELPFGRVAAWFQTWSFVGVLLIPLLLLLFPTGHLPSRRWAPVLWGVIGCTALLGVTSAVRPGPIDVSETVRPANPLGVEAMEGPATAVAWIAGLAVAGFAIASVVALVLRFRRSVGEERQQLRWLAFVGSLTVIFLLVVLLTSVTLESGESSAANDLSFLAFFLCLGLGIPAAIAVALLRYHLYDLDIVVKKTAVFAILVVLVMAVASFLTVVVIIPITWLAGTDVRALQLFYFLIGILVYPLWRVSRRVADRIVYGGRVSPYEVLAEFSERMSESYATDDVLPRMARIVREAAGASAVSVWLRVGGEFRTEAVTGDASWHAPVPLPGDELPELPGDLAAEIRHQGDLLGALVVDMPANDPMNPAKEKLVRDLAGQAGLVLRNVRLIEELRASRQRLVAAQDQERRRIERDIHDGAQQQLVALQVKQQLADQLIDRDPARAHEMMTQLQADTTTALGDLRDLARGIYPPLLADQGLAAALEAQARRAPLPVTVEPDGIDRYPPEVEATVYFCCLEALTNVAKYAEASHATITLAQAQGVLTFEVRDDGRGFDRDTAPRGSGFQGMADRLDAIAGELRVESTVGAGTRVRGSIRAGGSPRSDGG